MGKLLLCLILINSILMSDFIRDNTTGIVTNSLTGLMWQDDFSVTADTVTWYKALKRCEGLKIGGYSDWRLPKDYELNALADEGRFKHGMYPVFQNIGFTGYWSITTDYLHSDNAWFALYTCGGGYWYNKMSRGHVRCVRYIK